MWCAMHVCVKSSGGESSVAGMCVCVWQWQCAGSGESLQVRAVPSASHTPAEMRQNDRIRLSSLRDTWGRPAPAWGGKTVRFLLTSHCFWIEMRMILPR